MIEIGARIGQGNTAEIFEYGPDCVLKLYRAAMPDQTCRDEFRYTLLAWQATGKAPEPVEIVRARGRIGAVYKRLQGETMLKRMMARLWRSGHYAKNLADYHIDLQKPVDGELPTVKGKLTRDINHTDALPEGTKQKILQYLSGLPDGDTLCHFDFHPDNIMLSGGQYGILDWMTACKGDPLSDVARTGIILKYSVLPRVPAVVNAIAGAVKQRIYRNYIRRYLEKTGAKMEDIEKWELPVAAARLHEWIPEKETRRLLALIHRLAPRTRF